MGAAFLSGHCGIEDRILDNSAAYINGWLGRLRNDPKLVVMAAAKAQKSSDYIQGVKYEESSGDLRSGLHFGPID